MSPAATHPSLTRQSTPQPGCTQGTLLMSLGAQSCPQRRGSPRYPACIPFPVGSETLQKSSQRRRKRRGQTYGMLPSTLGRDLRVPVGLTWYMHMLGLVPLGR